MSKSPRLRKKKGRTSKYRNVHHSLDGKYIAQLTTDSGKFYLGSYDNEIEAAIAVDHFVLTTGEAKPLNLMDFPEVAKGIGNLLTAMFSAAKASNETEAFNSIGTNGGE